MTEVNSTKTKKPCKFGAKCKKRHCKFDHSQVMSAARALISQETNQRGDGNSTPTTETFSPQEDFIGLPPNVSYLLQSLTKTNETTIEAIASSSSMISKLQGENAQLMNVAQSTRRDLQLLQAQVATYLEQEQQQYNEKLIAVSQDAAKEKENAQQIVQTNAEQCIKKEREISQNLREELKASQSLVVQLLQKNNTATTEALAVERVNGQTMSSGKSGTALAATEHSESGTGNSLTFYPTTPFSNTMNTRATHNNKSSGTILASITDNVQNLSSSHVTADGPSRTKNAKNKTRPGLLFPSTSKSPSSSSTESPSVVPVETATDKVRNSPQAKVPIKAAAQQESTNIVVQQESPTPRKGQEQLDPECSLSRDEAIAEMARIQSGASPTGTKPKSVANDERKRASVDTQVSRRVKNAQNDGVKQKETAICATKDERGAEQKPMVQQKELPRQQHEEVAKATKHEAATDATEQQATKPAMDLHQRFTSVEPEQSQGGVSQNEKRIPSQNESQKRQTDTVGIPSAAKSTLTMVSSTGASQEQMSASEASLVHADTRLSLYMYPKKKATKKSISPIFDLLQNPTTLGIARKLLRYKSDLAMRKMELQDLEKGKSHAEAGIVEEKSLLESYEHQLEVYNEERNRLESYGIFDAVSGMWETYVAPAAPEPEEEEAPAKREEDYIKEAREELSLADSSRKGLALGEEKETRKFLEKRMKDLEKRKKQAQKMRDDSQNSKAHKTARLKEIEERLQATKKDLEDCPARIKSLEDALHEPYEPTVEEIGKLAADREDDDKKERSEKARQVQRKKDDAQKSKRQKAARLREIYNQQERIKKLMKDIPAQIKSLQAESRKWDEPIGLKKKELSEIRTKISQLVVRGDAKDDRFHIDDCRDDYGNSFLMVSAQNNDIDTASLCFELKADANATNHQGLTAMSFAFFFKFQTMVSLIAANGGTYPTHQVDAWKGVMTAGTRHFENVIDWDSTLRIAEQAAIPPETVFESADVLEASEESRMAVLTEQDHHKREFSFFDKSVVDTRMNSSNMRRILLLSKDVYRWFLDSGTASKSGFLEFLEALKPEELQQQSEVRRVVCNRRAVVGMKKTYEVLCSPLGDIGRVNPQVCLFTPFVTSAVDGVSDVGVLVWAVTEDKKASLYKTLIESTEFLRHKIEDDEQFPLHERDVMELGKDVHLLDLQSTSIFTSKPLELYTVDIDQGDLERLDTGQYSPKKRIAYYEEQLNKAVFDSSEEEAKDNEAILSGEQVGMSTSLVGGAGTGKTLLMTKKIVSVASERKVLVVSRLSRLISVIKGAVEHERDSSNVTFSTYDDLLSLLSRSVNPENESDERNFSAFSQVQYACSSMAEPGADSSVSFVDGFVGDFITIKEQKAMHENLIEPMTLWTAFRTIKSSARCSFTKKPLPRKDYLNLPKAFGLTPEQRNVVYDLYLRYEEWLENRSYKWDEADRVLYILRHGPSVFSEHSFKSWERRAYHFGEIELLEEDGESPLFPFFYDTVFADEAQDFSEIDLALFLRMSSGVRSLFLGADPAQSVELGVRMRNGTINDVFHNALSSRQGLQVKNVLQEIQMRTNHRTHAQNLAIATAVRSILARSFGVPLSKENALINGPVPEGLSLQSLKDLANEDVFTGGNIVFLAPDEMVDKLRFDLRSLGVRNDVFGVREAKGLEFNDVALIGFFSYIDALGNGREWENLLRWLSSSTGYTTTESSEKIQGRRLESCDYLLSHPEILDQGMLLYTALTRARNHLYLIEPNELSAQNGRDPSRGRAKSASCVGLDNFAFRRLKDLGLLKIVKSIHEGFVEMTAAQHKARGVLLVTQAISLSREKSSGSPISDSAVKTKFLEAADRFSVDKGNDKELLDQCLKHMEVVLLKRALTHMAAKFFDRSKGKYTLENRFADILILEQNLSQFFSLCIGDTFLVDEIPSIRRLMEDIFAQTPYEMHFKEILSAIKQHEP